MAGDEGVVGVSGEAPPERAIRILARPRYQTRLASNSTTAVNVQQSKKQYGLGLPDNEDVGVFVDDIVAAVSGGRILRRRSAGLFGADGQKRLN